MTIARDFGDVKRLAIAALLDPAIAGVRAVEPFVGQIADAIEGRTADFPLLAVLFEGEDYEYVDGPNWSEAQGFTVGIFVALPPPCSAEELDAATEALVRAVKHRLVNARLADNLQPVVPVRTRLVPEACSGTTLVYAFDFSVSMDEAFQWPDGEEN